jgi:hypothetical protein
MVFEFLLLIFFLLFVCYASIAVLLTELLGFQICFYIACVRRQRPQVFHILKKLFLHKLILMAMTHVLGENACNAFKDVHVESGYIDAH